ncbi:MAG: DNA repair protein RecO [Candidatus Paceibacterota bacterium]|nr:MAG: DNA repair protein RecO [Candidatus Paceibacterota bacterium]
MTIHAFILASRPSGERDRLVSVFSREEGRMVLVAKGAQRNTSVQRMHTDAFSQITCGVVRGRALPIMTSAQTVHAYPEMHASLPSLAMASFMSEACERLVPFHDPDEALWDFFTQTYEDLNAGRLLTRAAITARQEALLAVLGYPGPRGRCALCLREEHPDGWFTHADIGGRVCASCAPHGSLTASGAGAGDVGAQFEMTAGARFASLPLLRAVLQ